MSRRALIATALSFAPAVAVADQPSARVAALGWAAAQTLLALGIKPLAAPELARYATLVAEPVVPAGVLELGLRSEPNLELLAQLAPTLIVTEAGGSATDQLAAIAPVETFVTLRPGRRPTAVAREATLALAARLDRRAEADAYLSGYDTRLAAAADRLARYAGGPLCLVSDIFENRALVFGRNSLYQDVLDRVGIANAFDGATSVWGHATVGLQVLAELPADTRLVILTARIPDVPALLARRPLWRALPFLREGRVTTLADILFYGGLPSADRFARLLAERLPLGDAHG